MNTQGQPTYSIKLFCNHKSQRDIWNVMVCLLNWNKIKLKIKQTIFECNLYCNWIQSVCKQFNGFFLLFVL